MNRGLRAVPALLMLLVADALFLWMFLAADPLEQMASTGRISGAHATAASFAADWRHGMAGNSPLYMPGFFALAAAGWFWAGARSSWRLCAEGLAVLVTALGIAWLAAPLGAAAVVESFQRAWGVEVTGVPPTPSSRGMISGVFTAVTWTVVVVASRRAVCRRSLWPLTPVPLLAVGLALVRPWTVDDFTGLWSVRATHGDVVALGSLFAVPVLASVLVAQAQPHLVQTAVRWCRTNAHQ